MEQRRGIDLLAMIIAVVCLLAGGLVLMLQPPYRSLFSEFVSVPPLLVMVMLHSATPVIAGLTPALLLVEAVLRRRTERYLVALCVVALIAAAGLVIAFVAAIYLPIIRLSGELD